MMTYGVLNNREDTDFGIVLETNDDAGDTRIL